MGNTPVKLEGSAPKTMRRIVLVNANADMTKAELEVQSAPLPVPKSGELLVKVTAAAVNPSDYGEWKRPSKSAGDGEAKAIGKEGCGVVVASGGGYSASGLVGKNVGFVNLPKGQGSYSEYVTVSALKGAFVLPPSLPVEDAASFFVNPYTAYGIVDTVRQAGSKVFVHTAAASSLGKMLVPLCAKTKMTLINVVRRQEQAQMLKKLGAAHVVVTAGEKAEWMAELKELIDRLDVKVAFDAVAGQMSGDLLSLLPNGGTCFVYGGLSEQAVAGISPMDLIYRRKSIKGWLLTHWVRAGGLLGTVRRLRAASAVVNPGLAAGGWCSTKFVDVPIEGMWGTFLDMYTTSGFTDRKLRIRMDVPNEARKGWEAACAPSAEGEGKSDDGAASKEAPPKEAGDTDAPSEDAVPTDTSNTNTPPTKTPAPKETSDTDAPSKEAAPDEAGVSNEVDSSVTTDAPPAEGNA